MRQILAATLATTLAVPAAASAQDFPNRPLTMVVPFAAGGAVDVLGRTLAARTAEILGQQIVIENVGGAVLQLARTGFGIGDELLQVVGREILADDQQKRR